MKEKLVIGSLVLIINSIIFSCLLSWDGIPTEKDGVQKQVVYTNGK